MRKLVSAGAVAALILVSVSPAGATFPGRNGRIFFDHFSRTSPDQITSVTPRGTHARVLTDYKRGAVAPDVSPNGGRVAFTILGSRRVPDRIATMRAGGAHVKKLTPAGCNRFCLGDGEPEWSPDGRRILFNRAFGPIIDGDFADHVDLMVMNRNGTRVRTVLADAGNAKRDLEAGGWTWSPDGEQVAGTLLDTHSNASAIYTIELDSLDTHRITGWGKGFGNPDYSPDGRRIVFNSGYEGQVHSTIYTMNADGTDKRQLNHPSKHYTFAPRFSPSGNQIVYVVAGRDTTLHLSRMTVGGDEHARVTRDTLRGVDPDWAAAR